MQNLSWRWKLWLAWTNTASFEVVIRSTLSLGAVVTKKSRLKAQKLRWDDPPVSDGCSSLSWESEASTEWCFSRAASVCPAAESTGWLKACCFLTCLTRVPVLLISWGRNRKPCWVTEVCLCDEAKKWICSSEPRGIGLYLSWVTTGHAATQDFASV